MYSSQKNNNFNVCHAAGIYTQTETEATENRIDKLINLDFESSKLNSEQKVKECDATEDE